LQRRTTSCKPRQLSSGRSSTADRRGSYLHRRPPDCEPVASLGRRADLCPVAGRPSTFYDVKSDPRRLARPVTKNSDRPSRRSGRRTTPSTDDASSPRRRSVEDWTVAVTRWRVSCDDKASAGRHERRSASRRIVTPVTFVLPISCSASSSRRDRTNSGRRLHLLLDVEWRRLRGLHHRRLFTTTRRLEGQSHHDGLARR